MHNVVNSDDILHSDLLAQWTKNKHLIDWIRRSVIMCAPERIHLCDGSQEEYDTICEFETMRGAFVKLNEATRPNSYLICSNPSDVARVEDQTFVCSTDAIDAGPTNNWCAPAEMLTKLEKLFTDSMRGRTMYVVPFCMGPLDSPFSKIGVEITDSAYAVVNMHIMTRIGKQVIQSLGDKEFIPCIHSVGVPIKSADQDTLWPYNPNDKYIVHFPENHSIWSYGSGYGGNSLLCKKSFGLRIASAMARKQGWLAEHMLILGITNPLGEKQYFAAAFPSGCGKTNLAMLASTLPGWKVECVGDDIAWLKFSDDGILYAINPEAGFFGVAPETSMRTNPNAMLALKKNTLFTNVAYTDDGDVWWEGMAEPPPEHLIDWKGNDWSPGSKEKSSHPNARFTVSTAQCPVIDEFYQNPNGVPISAIIFGCRRSSVMPLVMESFSWQHGVLYGAGISSETTAAATGDVGKLRHDPFGMLPFCGYNMGDYFGHWLNIGKKAGVKLPKIYSVNWFIKDNEDNFIWPGFNENIRVLKWIFERTLGGGRAKESVIGNIPATDAVNTHGINLSPENMQKLLDIDKDAWQQEAEELDTYFKKFGDRLPAEIMIELNALKIRLHK